MDGFNKKGAIEMIEQKSIDEHLRQALAHLETALNQSVSTVLKNEAAKREIGQKWEGFLGEFFRYIREKGKENKVNLLGWISFPRIWK
jgi:hypothetical protein